MNEIQWQEGCYPRTAMSLCCLWSDFPFDCFIFTPNRVYSHYDEKRILANTNVGDKRTEAYRYKESTAWVLKFCHQIEVVKIDLY